MSVAIAVNQLTKRYNTFPALDRISFEVPTGQIMGFLGPNGAGKTTTLRILTGIIAPTSGSVQIQGIDVTEHSLEVRRIIGYLPEHVALYSELRVQEYLSFRARIKGTPGRERRARVESAMEQCMVADVRRKLVGHLSKGYRQRVALADCLLGSPSVLILDEPTVGLDPHQIRQTRDLIKELGRTKTILLSTHILPEVEMLCDQVTIINKGRIVAQDSPQRLRQRLQGSQAVRVQLKGNLPQMETALRELPGMARAKSLGVVDEYYTFELEALPQNDIRESVFQLAVARGWAMRELASTGASLEDVFVQIITQEETQALLSQESETVGAASRPVKEKAQT